MFNGKPLHDVATLRCCDIAYEVSAIRRGNSELQVLRVCDTESEYSATSECQYCQDYLRQVMQKSWL
jgi:hypothetical protein